MSFFGRENQRAVKIGLRLLRRNLPGTPGHKAGSDTLEAVAIAVFGVGGIVGMSALFILLAQ